MPVPHFSLDVWLGLNTTRRENLASRGPSLMVVPSNCVATFCSNHLFIPGIDKIC